MRGFWLKAKNGLWHCFSSIWSTGHVEYSSHKQRKSFWQKLKKYPRNSKKFFNKEPNLVLCTEDCGSHITVETFLAVSQIFFYKNPRKVHNTVFNRIDPLGTWIAVLTDIQKPFLFNMARKILEKSQIFFRKKILIFFLWTCRLQFWQAQAVVWPKSRKHFSQSRKIVTNKGFLKRQFLRQIDFPDT